MDKKKIEKITFEQVKRLNKYPEEQEFLDRQREMGKKKFRFYDV